MNKNILLIADLVSQSKNKFIFIWNGLLPSFEDVEFLKMITKENEKEISEKYFNLKLEDIKII